MKKNKLSLTMKIFIFMFLGAILGIAIRNINSEFIKNTIFLDGILKVLSAIFLNSIKMLVVPLVFVSITCGVASLSNIKSLGRIGGKTLLFYLCTTGIAITIAIFLALIVKPGVGVNIANLNMQETTIGTSKSITDIIIGIIPENPFKAMVEGDMLQVISFSLLFGIAISILGEKAEVVKNFMFNLNDIFLKMISIIMGFAPFGVFALMANTFVTTGFEAFIPLTKYMLIIVVALIVHAVVIYGGMFKLFTGLSIKPFINRFTQVSAVTFSTASSNAALPVSKKAMDECGVSNKVSSFTIPLGCTVNMDGTAIMQGVATVFIAQIYGIELTISSIITVIVTATLASIGTAGVPGVGLIMLSMVLTSIGLPVEGIGLIIGVDRILEMCRTTINVIGDCVCTIIVSKSENEFDENIYYDTSEKENLDEQLA